MSSPVVGTAAGSYPDLGRVTDEPTRSAIKWAVDRVGALMTLVRGPESGTLNPDQRPPNLGATDVGRKFYSTDFNRVFRWNGTIWTDDPSSDARYLIAFFLTTPEPGVGWAQCNGNMVARSTSDGRVQAFVTPSVPPYAGLTAFIRV